jgi:hypothetical protein
MNESARTNQIFTTPKYTSAARMNAADIWMYCDISSTRRRSRRSATTPPISVKSMIGTWPRNASRPRKKAEFVRVSTSQFWATLCIHVPMLEVQAPIQRVRKSR